ncbi:MAG: glycerophosphodiester phosphodiesterase [Actinomycetota bacterium]|nr:glycerophosphodiester phosphodiesterase [Actinomycetota bacterium]
MSNPWLSRRILNYAHQGGAREAPSSTLLAMRQALEAGAAALELDLHATADGEVVVCHDPTVDRTTNGTGCIADMTLEAVQSLDAAYWWVPGSVVDHQGNPGDYPLRGRAPADPALRIPTLREVLEAFPTTYLNVDIKQTAPAVQPYERLVAELFREHGREDDVIVASFHDDATAAFSAIAPDVSTAAGLAGMAGFYFAVRDGAEPPPMRHHALQVPPYHEGTTVVDPAFVGAAHEAGLAVHVWTIDDAEEMERLVDLGVDGIMTDCPSVLTGVLRSAGAGTPEAGYKD